MSKQLDSRTVVLVDMIVYVFGLFFFLFITTYSVHLYILFIMYHALRNEYSSSIVAEMTRV